jgi:putative pyruvate formate lyase activating enzyme
MKQVNSTTSYLDALTNCQLCPRKCGVNRINGEAGFCGAGKDVEIYRYGPHHGEEPPVSGTSGSGTVFFSRCTLSCIYCQNHTWSQERKGTSYGIEEFAGILRSIHEEGCHNWNFVSPTPWIPMIKEAVETVKRDGISLPVVYNTSGFEREETLLEYEGLTDIFLVDLRYARDDTCREASNADEYVSTARAAIKRMHGQVGAFTADEQGIADRGVICRLLILPGRADEAVDSLRWLVNEFGEEVAISVMSQYIPAYRAGQLETWDRAITREEYDIVRSEVDKLGLTTGWVQGFEGKVDSKLIGYEMKPVVREAAGTDT